VGVGDMVLCGGPGVGWGVHDCLVSVVVGSAMG